MNIIAGFGYHQANPNLGNTPCPWYSSSDRKSAINFFPFADFLKRADRSDSRNIHGSHTVGK